MRMSPPMSIVDKGIPKIVTKTKPSLVVSTEYGNIARIVNRIGLIKIAQSHRLLADSVVFEFIL